MAHSAVEQPHTQCLSQSRAIAAAWSNQNPAGSQLSARRSHTNQAPPSQGSSAAAADSSSDQV